MHLPRSQSGGLSVLLGSIGTRDRLIQVPVDHVVRNDSQPRTSFDAARIASLAESIAIQGIIQPIAVREISRDRFEIIAGERRWLAARQAGVTSIPAIVHDAGDRETLMMALAENLVRDDLNAIDVARAYASLIDDFSLTVSEVAKSVGKSRPTVANTLRLLELPDDVLHAIEAGRLSEGHGRALLQLEDRATQRHFAQLVVTQELSVRALESLVRQVATPRTQTRFSKSNVHPDLDDLVSRLREALEGVRIDVRTSSRSARIELRCADQAALACVTSSLVTALSGDHS